MSCTLDKIKIHITLADVEETLEHIRRDLQFNKNNINDKAWT